MLLKTDTVNRIVEGEIDCVFRRWPKPRAKAGGRQRTHRGELAIEAVVAVALDQLGEEDARRSGYTDLEALVSELARREGTVFRIDLHFAGEDPRVALSQESELGPDEVPALLASLARKDRREPWTSATLRLIGQRPGVRAGELAGELDQDLPRFKRRVRQLKELGLTISLERGYELSPRGKALLEHLP